jgi:carboxypeptidase Taq
MLITNPLILSVLEKYKNIYALKYLGVLANWDTETYMPSKGIEMRGQVMGKIEKLVQQLSLDPDFVRDIETLEIQQDQLNDYEKAVLRILSKANKKYRKLPAEFVEQFAELTAKSSTVWAEARKENDFKKFQPYLQDVFTKTKQMADYLGYESHPYEALIEDYEPGMSMNDFENYFTQLKAILSKFDLSKVKPVTKLPVDFDIEQLKKINNFILNYFNYDKNSMRLDESAHPFTNSNAINDIRITTNYHKDSPLSAIFSTIHEYGHGLFAYQTNPELEYTPQFADISYGIHESQSRFWENIIGRRKSFLKILLPEIQKLGPDYESIDLETVYAAANNVTPSLIRVEADELTYHFHILIRYEVEKAILDGKVSIEEASEFWNSKYEEYLGVKSENFADGIMQDIHWSLGYIGYFPTYSMGTVLSAVVAEKIEAELGNLDDLIGSAEGIQKIQNWLKENIHKDAGTYTYTELVKRFTGKPLDFAPWERYLTEKFSYLLK